MPSAVANSSARRPAGLALRQIFKSDCNPLVPLPNLYLSLRRLRRQASHQHVNQLLLHPVRCFRVDDGFRVYFGGADRRRMEVQKTPASGEGGTP